MDSTVRIEQKLYSALGEELSFHDDEHMAGVVNEATSVPPVLQEVDTNTPTIKRKRQNTLGDDRDRSPIAKMSREGADTMLDQLSSPRISGGVSVS